MNDVLYIAEGEIEKYFLEYLKKESLIVPGRFEKFNLMQNVLKATNRILTNKVGKVFCILDTDCVDINFLENLRKNIKSLSEISKIKIRLLIQKENFEDELKFILQTNDLGKLFGLKNRTAADVKRSFTNTKTSLFHLKHFSDVIKIFQKFQSRVVRFALNTASFISRYCRLCTTY